MLVKPREGCSYRRTDTKQLVDPEGFEADPTDLDIARALKRGDLVKVQPQAKASRRRGARVKE